MQSVNARQVGRRILPKPVLRLSDQIVAIAKLSDGTFWSASVDVVVTLAACTEEAI